MSRPTARLVLTAALLAFLVPAGPAWAQAQGESEGDLRRENQRLKATVSDLQQELDAARARIAELERQLQKLGQTGAPAPAPSAAPPEPEQVTINESVATASPRALFQAMQRSYLEATKELEIGDPATLPGERQRIAYQRAVRSWTARVHRELRGPVEWHVRVVNLLDPDDGVVRAQAVDPRTHAVLGDPFAMVLDKSARHRLGQVWERGPDEVYVIKGVVLPQPTMNPQRAEPGTFDKPRLIGPYAEFGFIVEAASINLPPVPAPEAPGTGS